MGHNGGKSLFQKIDNMGVNSISNWAPKPSTIVFFSLKPSTGPYWCTVGTNGPKKSEKFFLSDFDETWRAYSQKCGDSKNQKKF